MALWSGLCAVALCGVGVFVATKPGIVVGARISAGLSLTAGLRSVPSGDERRGSAVQPAAIRTAYIATMRVGRNRERESCSVFNGTLPFGMYYRSGRISGF